MERDKVSTLESSAERGPHLMGVSITCSYWDDVRFYIRMDEHDGEGVESVPHFSVNGSLCELPPGCCGSTVGWGWGWTRYRPKYDILGSVVAEVARDECSPGCEVGLAVELDGEVGDFFGACHGVLRVSFAVGWFVIIGKDTSTRR